MPRYDSIKLLHTLLLIITILLFGAYAAFLLRPYTTAAEREAGTLAGLLSHVPPEACDVLALAKKVRGFCWRVRGWGRVGGLGGLLAGGLLAGGWMGAGAGAGRVCVSVCGCGCGCGWVGGWVGGWVQGRACGGLVEGD